MDAARGSAFPSYHMDGLVDDDFTFLDSNLPSIDNIASDFSSFLDPSPTNGSLLPADEWSGTTNALPDTPQLQHAGLEGSSPLQQQHQTTTTTTTTSVLKQQQHLHPQQQQPPLQPNQQAFGFEPPNPLAATSQISQDVGMPGGNVPGDQVDSLTQSQQVRVTTMQLDGGNRSNPYANRQQVLLNGPTGFSSQPPQGLQTPRDVAMQSPGFQGLQSDPTVLQSGFGGLQPQRSYEGLQGRQLTMFPQGTLRFPRGLMSNGHFGGLPQQLGMQPQQGTISHLQGPDQDGSAMNLQAQLMNNQAGLPGNAQYISKGNPHPRQSMLQGHGFNSHLTPFSLQQSKQFQLLSNPQAVMNQNVIFPSSPHYQMPNSPAMGRHMLQPPHRLQNLPSVRNNGNRQQFLPGPQISPGPTDASRHPANAAKCAQLFMLCVQEQRKRPPDNNINFWRNHVQKFFAHGATQRWCLTSYSSAHMGRNGSAQGLFPMDYWYCNLCGVQPGKGFESGTDVLPRLFKIKYDSGLLDELLFLDVATERYTVPSGKIVLEYSRAVHESVYAELRVIRHGKLRVTFNSYFKICAWEFCTKSHEEVVPRKNLVQQVHQLASLVVEADQENFDKSADNLKSHCNAFTKAAKQLAVQLDAPMVNDLGYSKRFVRCLQITEVVNSMTDLISYEKKLGVGPIESLARFPTLKRLQMEGALGPSVSLTQVINDYTQGPSSIQSSTVTRLHSESMSEAQDQAVNQAQSSVFKGMEVANMSAIRPSYNQMPIIQTQQGPVSSHQISQLTSQGQPQPLSQAQGLNSNQLGQPSYQQQVVGKTVTVKSSMSQPGTPQSEMSDVRSNT